MNLLNIMENYCAKLRSQRVRNIDARESPRTALETRTNVQIINKTSGNVNRNLTNAALLQKDVYDPISIREHLETSDRRRVYDIIEVLLQHGLNKKCVHYIHNLGGNKQTLHFLWEIPQESPESELIKKCTDTITSIEANIPIDFMRSYGFIGNPAALCSIFKDLTGDRSAPINLSTSEMDSRFEFAMLCEDENIIVDLRQVPSDKSKDTFKIFFEETNKYLSEDIGEKTWREFISCKSCKPKRSP